MQKLSIRQTQEQRLSLSPQLMLSIKMMGAPLLDLRDEMLKALDENPALELKKDSNLKTESDYVEKINISETYYDGEDASDAYNSFIESIESHAPTLQEHLLSQINVLKISEKLINIATFIVQNLDENGFLLADHDVLQKNYDKNLFFKALKIVQNLDPKGCATKDYKDSLAVQVKILSEDYFNRTGKKDKHLELTYNVLTNYFDAIKRGRPEYLINKLSKLAPELKIKLEDARLVFEIIRSLEPFPGNLYKQVTQRWIVPDVIIEKKEDGFNVVINDEVMPEVIISAFYKELVAKDDKNETNKVKETKNFAREKINDAKNFLTSISRRNITISRVMRSLIEFQHDFFVYGPSRIAPLRMKDIALELDYHETTISRVARGKYFQCDWGIFEIKYLFSNQVGISDSQKQKNLASSSAYVSGPHSRKSVKYEIKKIIETSDKKLSDQNITDKLLQRGIKISRRTVAKYRNEMDIGSSFER